MAQKQGLDFNEILNTQKVLLVKLSQGLIGEENSYLLGTLFVTKLHQAAQARQSFDKEERKPFFLYIDEFQNFITPSMSSILSGARKYGLGLILAHQDLEQLTRRDAELANSVLSNPATRICFRCGDRDASKLESGFSHFDSNDLQNLSIGQAIARVSRKDYDFNISFDLLPKMGNSIADDRLHKIIDHCRRTYAIPREKIEIAQGHETPVHETLTQTDLVEAKEGLTPPTPITPLETKQPIKRQSSSIQDRRIEVEQHKGSEVEKIQEREHRSLQVYVRKEAQARNLKAIIPGPIRWDVFCYFQRYNGKIELTKNDSY